MNRRRAGTEAGGYHPRVTLSRALNRVDVSTLPALYDAPPLRHSQALPLTGGHLMQVQEFGNPQGIPALVLHGGPGSGCSPLLGRFFNPERFRVICPDQRGAGRSTPRGGTAHNTTADLLDDLQTLRQQLGLRRWLVVGGSWGATLAVAHAAALPQAVSGLLLRASFLARPGDVQAFFQGAATARPKAWARLADAAPADARDDLLAWLAQDLHHADGAVREHAARAWWAWEQALAQPAEVDADIDARPPALPHGEALAALIDRYRVQAHYLQNGCWLTARTLLQRCAQVPAVPTLLLHGRDDAVCPPDGARALHTALPASRLQWVAGAGHDPTHPAMVAAMVGTLDHFAEHGHFGSQP